jgi:hypothetical protein
MATRRAGKQVTGSLPNAVYSARGRARRLEQGGEPIGGTLGPEAGQALRDLLEMGAYETKLAAIEAALIRERDRCRRRKGKTEGED